MVLFKITDLGFARDVAINLSLKSIYLFLKTFSSQAKPLGLQVTKTMILDLEEPAHSVHAMW